MSKQSSRDSDFWEWMTELLFRSSVPPSGRRTPYNSPAERIRPKEETTVHETCSRRSSCPATKSPDMGESNFRARRARLDRTRERSVCETKLRCCDRCTSNRREKTFDILVANFGNHPFRLISNQTIARVDDHPTNLAESHISLGELLGITEDTTHYKKHDINVRDTETINKHLADTREAEHGQVEELSLIHI